VSRLVVAGLAVVLVLAGCGGGTDARRRDVNRYIHAVNQIERDAVVQMNRARDAYVALGRGKLNDLQLTQLDVAPDTIRQLRGQIAALSPPQDVRHMHATLLRLLSMDAAFATEVGAFAHYVRAVGPIEQRIGVETAQLRRDLKRAHTSGPEQAALTRFADGVNALIARFHRLQPPRSLAPWHTEQVARLSELRTGARFLTRGLARRDRAVAARGLTMLTNAAVASPVTPADRSAILAYDRRLKQIGAVAARLTREQRGLAKELA
jgi:hypothetical protein